MNLTQTTLFNNETKLLENCWKFNSDVKCRNQLVTLISEVELIKFLITIQPKKTENLLRRNSVTSHNRKSQFKMNNYSLIMDIVDKVKSMIILNKRIVDKLKENKQKDFVSLNINIKLEVVKVNEKSIKSWRLKLLLLRFLHVAI